MSSELGDDALKAGNEVFHEAYSGARDGVRQQVPILVVLPGELALHRQNRRQCMVYSRPAFARAMSAAHIAVALFALTGRDTNPDLRGAGVGQLIDHISAALEGASRSTAPPIAEIDVLLQRCLLFAKLVRESTVDEAERAEFARDAGPRILRITESATREQISGLHDAVEAIFGQLSSREQAELQVVVVGDHQARVRSLGMQYFKRRFHEGNADQRVTYGENVEDEQEAISLVATRRLDQCIARAFFGDEHRLQRDVLGDAAKRCLDEMRFPD
ncbi:MAG TPA: hypothetical protein VFK05_22455 [Polyangiaceae bacterium]|nr:hypothetical protein [Polyangiaceae bacterium]